jgi:hypothetical protein
MSFIMPAFITMKDDELALPIVRMQSAVVPVGRRVLFWPCVETKMGTTLGKVKSSIRADLATEHRARTAKPSLGGDDGIAPRVARAAAAPGRNRRASHTSSLKYQARSHHQAGDEPLISGMSCFIRVIREIRGQGSAVFTWRHFSGRLVPPLAWRRWKRREDDNFERRARLHSGSFGV